MPTKTSVVISKLRTFDTLIIDSVKQFLILVMQKLILAYVPDEPKLWQLTIESISTFSVYQDFEIHFVKVQSPQLCLSLFSRIPSYSFYRLWFTLRFAALSGMALILKLACFSAWIYLIQRPLLAWVILLPILSYYFTATILSVPLCFRHSGFE